MSIHGRAKDLPAFPHGSGKIVENADGIVPADAGVRDADAVSERRFTLGWDFLTTFVDVALDHEAHDGGLAGCDLVGDDAGDFGLIGVFLLRVPVAAVDHESVVGVCGPELGLCGCDAGGVVVGAGLAASEDDEGVVVAGGADDGDNAWFGDGEEVVGVFDGADGVDGRVERPVRAVLEADREGESRCEFPVELALGRAGADGANR